MTVAEDNLTVTVYAIRYRDLFRAAVLCSERNVIKLTVVTCLERDNDLVFCGFLQLTDIRFGTFKGGKRLV